MRVQLKPGDGLSMRILNSWLILLFLNVRYICRRQVRELVGDDKSDSEGLGGAER